MPPKRRLTPSERIDELLGHYKRAKTPERKAKLGKQIQGLHDALQRERLNREIMGRMRGGLLPAQEPAARISKEVQQQIGQVAKGLKNSDFGMAWKSLQIAEKNAKTVQEKQVIARYWLGLANQAVIHQSSFSLIHLNGALVAARKAKDKNLVRQVIELAARAGYSLE